MGDDPCRADFSLTGIHPMRHNITGAPNDAKLHELR
jgi:hypothetical protein